MALATLPALAQTASEPVPASPPPPSFIFKLGGQFDGAQGRALQGKVTWNASEALTLFISGVRSNLAATSQTTPPNGNETLATTASLGGDYLFGLFDLGLQVDHSEMTDLLASRRYYFQPAFETGRWRLGFEWSRRTTDFDRLHFRNLVISTDSGPLYVSGYADMSLQDTGLGANLEYSGDVWRAYGAYTRYNYGPYQGGTDVTRIRTADGAVSPAMFLAMAGKLVNRLERMSTSRLNRRAALLDSTSTVGLEANLSRTTWGLEASQDRDHLTNLGSTTYTVKADWKVTPRFTVAVQVGATRSDVFGTDGFAGLNFLFRTRPNPWELFSDWM